MFANTMRTRFQFILLIGLILILSHTQAQSFGSNVLGVPSTQEKKDSTHVLFKPDITVALGSSFMSFAPGYNTFNTFIAPKVTLPVAKKVSVSVGMGYSSMFNSYGSESLMSNGASHYGSLFVSGTYQLNDKISVSGTAYKTFLLNPSNFTETSQPQFDFSNQGVILDVNYSVTDHFHIQASFQYREQNHPNYYFGQPNHGFGSPDIFNPGGIDNRGGFGPGF